MSKVCFYKIKVLHFLKKDYCIDNGLRSAVLMPQSNDNGKKLENTPHRILNTEHYSKSSYRAIQCAAFSCSNCWRSISLSYFSKFIQNPSPASSSKNGITPTYMIPSSSIHCFVLPSTITILRKKSPEFFSENVSWLRFSFVSTFNADWM